MRRQGPGDGVVQVELLEADADLEVDGADDGGVGDAREAARARRLRWVGLAVVVTLVGTILTATVIDARQDAARRAELAELDWVLPPSEGPLEEMWRSSAGWTVAQTDELIVLAGHQGGIRALDPATGVEAWTHDGAGVDETCSPLLDYREVGFDEIVADFVYCHPWVGYQESTPAAGLAVPIDFIEIATGAEMAPLVVDGSLVMSDVVDGDLLVTFVDSSAALGALRWDPRAGEVWSYRSAPGFVPNGAVVNYFEAGVDEPDEGAPAPPVRLSYGVADGVLRLTDAIALDLATGEQVTVPPIEASSPYVNVRPLPDGGSVEVRFETWPDGGWSETARVLNADGSLRFEIDGTPGSPWQTDGSDADVLTVIRPDGRVAGIDPGTGRTRWTTSDTASVAPTFVLEDVMVLVGSSGVLAIDVHDGEELWHAEDVAVWNDTAATDGDLVLVQSAGEGGPELVALDLRTGAEAWRIPIRGSYWYADNAGGNLLLFGDEEIVALG